MAEPTPAQIEAAARNEAEKRWPHLTLTGDWRKTNAARADQRLAFVQGAAWAALTAAAQVSPVDGGSEADCGCGNLDAHRAHPAPRTVSAAQRLAVARLCAGSRHGAEHVPFYERTGGDLWQLAMREADAILAALHLTETP